ncbi:MAG TPA: ferric reductase-like transmembrane domain-containing protein [Solirubrobacteraceae bacterium]|nr:ferric reductase-like transmembrane domain-containing protein [Solirubrobacteraceae bacterium]
MTVLAANTSTWAWYFSRATGTIALVLLTAILVLGVLGPLRVSTELWPRFAIGTLHRDAALLALVLVAIHVLTITADAYVRVPLTAAILPVGSSYAPVWTGLGAIAFDLMLALVGTSLLRARLGFRAWRLVHWSAYLCWPLAVAHGIATGTDASSAWYLIVTVVCIAVAVVAVAMRVQGGSAAGSLEV